MTFGTKAGLFGLVVALAPFAVQAQAPAAAVDAVRGATLVKQRCAVCHSLVDDTGPRPGPSLKGVVGRKAGTLVGFKYSPAMKAANISWDKARLDVFLTGPGKAVPGTFMMIPVSNPKDRTDIVAYLETLKK
jgi:cytochrome c